MKKTATAQPKTPLNATQRYRFRYWRRSLRRVGVHLDRATWYNNMHHAANIAYELSGHVCAHTFAPMQALSAAKARGAFNAPTP